ncbi:MAG: PAC2 family protein [Propionibacteriaceae bacterium]|jgi:proteasome assembly chaperone (PAC2) family protein|nr:PAC2 family protein [Micropruina sp.]HBX80834.1 carboxylate--amine ligase [Propionibacteriaceae bacterium]HBY22704.1 carboxylate--amine ligase [Propionibacteriaceae bacterium]
MPDLRHLREPALIIAMGGWNDATSAATGVVEHLIDLTQAEMAFDIDVEEFIDYQVARPRWVAVEGASRELDWPSIEFLVASLEDRDLVLLTGPEPNLRWREFTSRVVSVARSIKPKIVVTLGAMLTDAPHSRPTPVAASTTDAGLADRLGVTESEYEGPTGIIGVLADALGERYPVVALWASAPHYVAETPNPKATLALLRELEDVLDIPLDSGDLGDMALAWEKQIDEMAGDDPDVAAYIATLEERRDSELPQVTGDTIAAEFQKYLRRRNR